MSNRDHPRVGGEKLTSLSNRGTLLGSPPRGRGKDSAKRLPPRQWRITPAWAGKSITLPFQFIWQKDHPRVGGEKPGTQCPAVCYIGSPPRGRGKDQLGAGDGRGRWITPAWAGKRFCKEIAPPSVEDHPRVGGEKHHPAVPVHLAEGSPPRGRGKAGHPVPSCMLHRITPAWAGKSKPNTLQTRPKQDHPRVGGEKMSA